MASKKIVLKKSLDDKIHHLNALKKSNDGRKNKKFPDAVLRTRDGTDVPIHRNIVSANSAYFLTIFEAEQCDIIEIKDDISGKHLEMIMDYIYTGILQIRFEDVLILNKYAIKYCIKSLENETTSMIFNNITSETCLEYWRHAGDMVKFDLEQQCFNYALKNTELFFISSIKDLSYKELEAISSNPRISCSQEILCRNIIIWIKVNFCDRQQYIGELLSNVDLSNVSLDFIKCEILNDKKLWEFFIELSLNINKFQLSSDEFKSYSQAQNLNSLFNNEYLICDKENEKNQSICDVTSANNLNEDNKYMKISNNKSNNDSNFESNEAVAFTSKNMRISNEKCLLITQNALYDINLDMNRFDTICKHNRRWNFAVNSYNSNLILLSGGGYCYGSNTCQLYNDTNKELIRFPIMRKQRRWHRTIAVNDQIYACGGSSINGNIEIFDLNSNKWITCESKMLEKNRNFGVTSHGGSLYTFGGTLNYANSNTVEFFDPRDGKWIDLKMNLNGLGETRSISYNNSIFCFGSTFGQIFDVRQNRWNDIINYPKDTKKLSSFDVVEMNNNFYIASASVSTQKLLLYEHASNSWSTKLDKNIFNSTGEIHFAKISSNEWNIIK